MIKPMLAEMGSFQDLMREDYGAELKVDGTRGIIYKDGNVEIVNREGDRYTPRIPEIVASASAIPDSYIMDGEIVYFNGEGRTEFTASQRRCSTSNLSKIIELKRLFPLYFLAFDLLRLNGEDLTTKPYIERKALLRKLIRPKQNIAYLEYSTDLKETFRLALERGEEGVILKRLSSIYKSRRDRDWIKVKRFDTEVCDVVGYTVGSGKRKSTFGSLILSKDGRYAGAVGSGFSDLDIQKTWGILQRARRTEQKFSLEEEYVSIGTTLKVKVKFYEKTESGVFRFPSLAKEGILGEDIFYLV